MHDELYALRKAQGLDLRETELVMLSACDAGSGTPDLSEGTPGLQWAFRIVDARDIPMSLRSLADESARWRVFLHQTVA